MSGIEQTFGYDRGCLSIIIISVLLPCAWMVVSGLVNMVSQIFKHHGVLYMQRYQLQPWLASCYGANDDDSSILQYALSDRIIVWLERIPGGLVGS